MVSVGKGVNLVLSLFPVPSMLLFFSIDGKTVVSFLGPNSILRRSLSILINIFSFIAKLYFSTSSSYLVEYYLLKAFNLSMF